VHISAAIYLQDEAPHSVREQLDGDRDNADGGATDDQPVMGPSIPGRVSMDPAMVNVDAVRTKDVPSIGAFASARGLARVVDTTFHRGIKPKTLKVSWCARSLASGKCFPSAVVLIHFNAQ
jgi:hypothetical protein